MIICNDLPEHIKHPSKYIQMCNIKLNRSPRKSAIKMPNGKMKLKIGWSKFFWFFLIFLQAPYLGFQTNWIMTPQDVYFFTEIAFFHGVTTSLNFGSGHCVLQNTFVRVKSERATFLSEIPLLVLQNTFVRMKSESATFLSKWPNICLISRRLTVSIWI